MKILILGGTLFVGRHLVDAALSRGQDVTLFNRGQHNAELYPEVEKLRGDRGGNLEALRGRRWDAVIDTCGYLPQQVQATTKLLAEAVDLYAYISTVSVYAPKNGAGLDEGSAVQTLTDEQRRELAGLNVLDAQAVERYGALYGALKVLCEAAAEAAMPGRAFNVRAGLITGPHDYRDRFTYWVRRVAAGGEVLAPDSPERPLQFIDARDLAAWIISMIERRQAGTYNATGPDYQLTMGRFLDECVAVSGSGARLVWVSSEFLKQSGVAPMTELPMWHPDRARFGALASVSYRKAVEAGLTLRPLVATIRDTLVWDATRPGGRELCAGLKPERERQLLEDWQGVCAAH